MIPMPSVESFLMWAIPCKVSCISTHKMLTFLLLVVIHDLCHPEGQSLYVVWFGWVPPTGSGSGGNQSASTVATHPTGIEYFL